MSNVYKEFTNRVFGLDYQLHRAAGNPNLIKAVLAEANANLRLITIMAEDAMEYVADFAVQHGIDKTMQEITHIERLHTHYVKTLSEYQMVA